MLKSFWPLWLLAGALTLCIAGMAWLHFQVRDGAEALGALRSTSEANARAVQGLRDEQDRQAQTLLGWEERRQDLAQTARQRAKTVREAGKNADFKHWADQPLPADAVRLLQSTGLAH